MFVSVSMMTSSRHYFWEHGALFVGSDTVSPLINEASLAEFTGTFFGGGVGGLPMNAWCGITLERQPG